MNSVLERRVSRLELAASTRLDELFGCEPNDEAKRILRAVLTRMGHLEPEEVEVRADQQYLSPCDHVAGLSPVEREQRLLAIRGMVADIPVAMALLERALGEFKPVVRPLSSARAHSRSMGLVDAIMQPMRRSNLEFL
jgi:hypothetical protein